jgi:N-acylglucosamine 2-epimerase
MTTSELMTPARVDALLATYRDGLLNSTLPFWFPRSIDEELGGFMFSRDRDGALLDTDKAIWLQGRASWLLATLYSEVEPRPEWLAWARHGIDFLRRHGFDDDGRMFFLVDREGRPLRKRRYIFSETFMIAALAAYSRATGDAAAAQEALALYQRVQHDLDTPGALPPKWDTTTRPMRGLAIPMIMTVTAQILRQALPDPRLLQRRHRSLHRRDPPLSHAPGAADRAGNSRPLRGAAGSLRRPHPQPRPRHRGVLVHHAGGALRGNDPALLQTGLTILDWMWARGWDQEHGGITYFVDVHGLPVQEYWHDMKFWWPQNETIIATLMAYHLTGDEKYARWHQMIHDWTYARFPDPSTASGTAICTATAGCHRASRATPTRARSTCRAWS